MKVLIIGASGLVGGALVSEFFKGKHQVLGTYNNFSLPGLVKLDFNQKKEVEKIVVDFKPETLLLPAAYASVDACEKNPELCYKINWQGAKNVIDICKSHKIPFLFFSTDYIFDGKSGPYKEEDKPNPQNVYGKVKLEMENYIKGSLQKYLIIRTANVFGWEKQGKNFVVRLIKDLKEGKRIPVVTDQIGSPTYVGSLARVVRFLVEGSAQGIFHVAGKEVLSRFDFALLVAQVFDLDKNLIQGITTDKISQAAKRPLKGGLKVDKVEGILPFPLLRAREGLEEMRKDRFMI